MPVSDDAATDRREVLYQTERSKQEAMELSWSANAYLDCAGRLCNNLIDGHLVRSPHHCRVALHLAFLALELWFKSALAAVQCSYPARHDLDGLRKLYNRVMPDIPLPIPSYLDDLIPRSGALFADAKAPSLEQHFLRLRYPSDRHGRPYPDLQMLDLAVLAVELNRLSWEAQKVQLKIWVKCGWLTPQKEDEERLDAIYRRPFPPGVQ